MSHVLPADSAAAARPTHIRHLVVALTALMAFLLYLDRFCLSFVEQYIKQEMGLSDAQIGLLLGSFFAAYALAQVPSGWLSDRYAARLMLTLYILFWSIFTGVTGLASSFAMVLLLRLGCGLAQAGAYPTGANIISKWVLFSGRGLASAIVSIGGRIGGAAAPVLTAYLIVACVPNDAPSALGLRDILDVEGLRHALSDFTPGGTSALRQAIHRRLSAGQASSPDAEDLLPILNQSIAYPDLFAGVDLDDVQLDAAARKLAGRGKELTPNESQRLNRLLLEAAFPEQIRKIHGAGWRPVMLIYGAVGLLVAGAFWLGVADEPRRHPLCNASEVARIEESRPPGTTNPHGDVGAAFLALLVNFNLWLISLGQFFTNFGWIFLGTWLPRYLAEKYPQVSTVERGWLASYPVFAAMFAVYAGGWITDRAAKWWGVRLGRMLPIAVTRFLGAAGFLACLLVHAPWSASIAFAAIAVATDLGTPAMWAYAQDVGGRHSGSVLGWINMWGNLGAALSPFVLILLKDAFSWNAVFWACGTTYVISGVLSLGIDATVPLLARQRDDATV